MLLTCMLCVAANSAYCVADGWCHRLPLCPTCWAFQLFLLDAGDGKSYPADDNVVVLTCGDDMATTAWYNLDGKVLCVGRRCVVRTYTPHLTDTV